MDWERVAVAAAVIGVALLAARIVDRAIQRRTLDPETATRYRVVRQTASSAILAVGVLSALLTIPAVRAIAGGILASSAVAALVLGLAAQRTLANVVAGVLIAFSQPLRFGDRVEVAGHAGVVEEIQLTYTFIRLDDGSRLVIPNEKLASDTIVNATIRSPEKVAEVTLQVPPATELRPALELLRREVAVEPGAEVYVGSLEGSPTLVVRVPAPSDDEADLVARDLRVRAHESLRAGGLLG